MLMTNFAENQNHGTDISVHAELAAAPETMVIWWDEKENKNRKNKTQTQMQQKNFLNHDLGEQY